MIVEDVRIKERKTTIGHQLEESIIDYYDVQILVFDNWWSLDKNPERCTDLGKAIKITPHVKTWGLIMEPWD